MHFNTRCIHGDEATHRMKVYLFRFWKEPVLRRQACLDCGKALELLPICSMVQGQHVLINNRCSCSIHDITQLGAAHATWCAMAD